MAVGQRTIPWSAESVHVPFHGTVHLASGEIKTSGPGPAKSQAHGSMLTHRFRLTLVRQVANEQIVDKSCAALHSKDGPLHD